MHENFDDTWRVRIKHAGSVIKLARRLGVKRVQIYRWAGGVCPPNGSAAILLEQLDQEIKHEYSDQEKT